MMKITPGTKFKSVDDYVSCFPEETQELMQQLRTLIKKTAPKAEECISYNIPAYKLNGMLVYFAGYKTHIGFYPTSSGIRVFEKELKDYKTSKGTVQFPLENGIPTALVKKIVQFRMKENLEKKKVK